MEGTQRQNRVLILNDPTEQRIPATEVLAEGLPQTEIVFASSAEEFRSILDSETFDVVVLDDALVDAHPIELIHQLRMREDDPSVLMVSQSTDPHGIAEAYNNGCHRCIHKAQGWIAELAPTIRTALRYRRLKERNRELYARLIEANIRLEEKNKRLDEFSATIAHDIRGPLGAVAMRLDFVTDRCRDSLDPKMLKVMRGSLDSIDRLLRLVQGMYDWAKLGAQATEMTKVALNELLTQVVADSDLQRDPRDIRITIDDGLPVVWGNDPLLRRLFSNLLTNAVRYNDSDPVQITVARIGEVQDRLGRYQEIAVSDNGRGIPASEQATIFSMFGRGSSSAGDAEGSGIGLAVVERIVELHMGKIRVHSEGGKGTTFFITLPVEAISLTDFEAVNEP